LLTTANVSDDGRRMQLCDPSDGFIHRSEVWCHKPCDSKLTVVLIVRPSYRSLPIEILSRQGLFP
jgi:hypothetical protein